MCEYVAGELIICHDRSDHAAEDLILTIRHHSPPFDRVIYLGNIRDKLSRLGLSMREGINYELHRVRVPEGQETFYKNACHVFYLSSAFELLQERHLPPNLSYILRNPQRHFSVEHNHLLALAAQPGPEADEFSLLHEQYKDMLGLTNACSQGEGQRICVIDSGLLDGKDLNIVTKKNFVNPQDAKNPSEDVADEIRHGMFVNAIIHDIAPDAELVVYKVIDKNDRASEWDTLAALLATQHCQIINLSLQFGLDPVTDEKCGRESSGSRSMVFETILGECMETDSRCMIVAAAGNKHHDQLAFPARFANVIAVESINSSRDLSSFSNYGAEDANGNHHHNVFVLPGGEFPTPNQGAESIMAAADDIYGTSFAAAYASGLIACLRSAPGFETKSRDELLDHLRQSVDAEGYDSLLHGNGLMRLNCGP